MTMHTAAYARYSSDQQRSASLDDQLRNCRDRCAREGWPEPTIYTDAAISGARADRPGYRALLADAEQLDIVVVDDLSRLSRDSVECAKAVKRLTFAGARLIGLSDGVDTARSNAKADVGLRGLMSDLYLDDLAAKTHRGLKGRALAGASAGGLPYGYRVTTTGERAIDPQQADTVRRIHDEYQRGKSPRSIARALSSDGVPPPRGKAWSPSAIHGDVQRGIGILANPIYAGRMIWNRSHWVKHPDTGRRLRRERPESDWIIVDKPELAILDDATWNATQHCLHTRGRATTGGRHRGGPGRPARHLLSGILHCADCGGPIVVINARCYGCARHHDRGDGACANTLTIPREEADAAILRGIRETLRSDSSFRKFQRAVVARLKRAAPNVAELRATLRRAETERDNIMTAIRAGIITPTTRGALRDAERAVEDGQNALAAASALTPARVLPRARDVWNRLIEELGNAATTAAARDVVAEILGPHATATQTESGAIYAEKAPQNQQDIKMVAGARYARYLPDVARIELCPPRASRR